MRKKLLLIIVSLLVATTLLATLCACESYKAKAISGGDKNASVESNGGLVVKQGNYLYFVNGYSGYLTKKGKDNWFGNVVKGAIVRVSYNNGALGDDYQVIVPKSVMSDSKNVGFSIFGNYIYYTSPSAEEDRYGNVQTDTIQFMRTKIDGTGTQVILNYGDKSVDYKYTSKALVYYDNANQKIYSKSITASKFNEKKKGDCIAKDVTSAYFPKCDEYDPKATTLNINDYIFYTKAAEEDYEKNNVLYVCNSRGKNNKVVIDGTTFGDTKYNVKIISAKAENNKLSIYYTKTYYVGTDSNGTVEGTYAYQFADSTFAFDKTKEVQLTTRALSTIYVIGYDAGIVAYGSDVATITYYTNGDAPTSYGALKINTLVAVDATRFYYLNGDNIMLVYNRDNNSNAQKVYDGKEKVMTSFTGVEYFDGYLYFVVDDDYDYVNRIKCDSIDIYNEETELVFERIGIVTKADKAAMKTADEKETETK